MWFLFLTYLTPAAEKTLCAAAKAASLQGYAQSVLPDSSSSSCALSCERDSQLEATRSMHSLNKESASSVAALFHVSTAAAIPSASSGVSAAQSSSIAAHFMPLSEQPDEPG